MNYKLFISCIFFLSINLLAIGQNREIPVYLVIEKVEHKNIRSLFEKSTEAVFKFYHDTVLTEDCINKECLVINSQNEEDSLELSNNAEMKEKREMKVFNIATASEVIRLRMENYEDDKGEICTHDKGDDNFYITPFEVKLSELNPGIFSPPFPVISEKEKFISTARVRYGIPQPNEILQDLPETICDPTKALTLRSSVDLKNKNGLTFQWEFKIAERGWLELGRPTVTETVVFNPLRDIFKESIKENQVVKLRMKAIGPEINSDYSPEISLQFTPEVPKIEDKDIEIVPACPNTNSGSIAIKSLHSTSDSISYYIIKGKNVQEENYPDVIKQEAKVVEGAIVSKGSFIVDSLDEGEYTLIIHNAQQKVGKVFVAFPFNINKFPILKFSKVEVENISCDSLQVGKITVTSEGGNPGKLTYYINPAVGKTEIFDHKAVFSNLPTGAYSVIIEDECSQHISKKQVEVSKKFSTIEGIITVEDEPKNKKSNGSVKIKITGGSGLYDFQLNGKNLDVRESDADNKWMIERLPEGSFELKVVDRSSACSFWDTTFVLRGKSEVSDKMAMRPDNESSPGNEINSSEKDLVKENNKRPISGMFTKRDDKLNFFGAIQKTSVSYASFNTEAGKSDYRIVVEKSKYRLTILDYKGDTIITYPVVFGNKDQNDKMCEGDRKTPEGDYQITEKKEHEKWNKILYLNYPTASDYVKFNGRKKDKLIASDAKIGDLIAIHGTRQNEEFEIDRGNNWTDGCVATKNIYIDQLYKYIKVGTKVTIKK